MPCPHCPHCIAAGAYGILDKDDPAMTTNQPLPQARSMGGVRVTAANMILTRLRRLEQRDGLTQAWLAVHEFAMGAYSQNNVGTRLPELARQNFVVGRPREGKPYKEWGLTDGGRVLADGLIRRGHP